ncbi:hypothetical protein CRE_20946 [Caenorhabditis remanei]|uniref:Uncharacterized protein n=1 Tax=Caenorhabditis remanei TaxID=31234 RepID=E3NCR3_CAERE|nr:hypothetical protein CRE_20946 [Caenorhabditis remanei]
MQSSLEEIHEQHRRAGRLFQELLPTKPQQSKSLEPLNQKNMHMFLPPFLKSSQVAKVEKVEVITEIKDNKPVLTYQFKWIEKYEKPPAAAETASSETDVPAPLVKKKSSMMKISGNVLCDGPCGKIVPQKDTSQFGCDHVICDTCLKKNASAALFDGSPGCCNETCVKLAGDKVCSGQSDSKPSVCTVSKGKLLLKFVRDPMNS